jgi:Domain of unknown function (DUF4395)
MRESRIRFIRQQGFSGETFPDSLYTALMLQPRIVGCLAAVGVLLQSAWLFLALAAALWWSALVPTRSPFDAIYNHVVAYRRGLPPLGPAPTPRRFAGGGSGAVALAIGAALLAGATSTAWIIQGVFAVGIISAVFADFCIPAYTYHLRRRLSPGASAFSASKGDGPSVTRGLTPRVRAYAGAKLAAADSAPNPARSVSPGRGTTVAGLHDSSRRCVRW